MTSTTGLVGVLFDATLGGAGRGPASAGAPDSKLIEDLVAANRILADQGIVDGYGHVSARHDRDPTRYLLSRDLAPALVTADDIMEYELDSNPVDAKGRSLYSERFIHGEIYKARPDVRAVVHSHSPAVIPFSVSGISLRPVFHAAAFIVDGVPVFDTRRVPGPPHLLINSPEAGRALAQTLGSKPAVLILGHGVAVVGTSLPMVVGRSIYLETSAKIQSQAIALGGQLTELDPAAARELASSDYRRPWELWKRRVTMK
ncbi:MAG TPA: class II aldolase/adducin family protein [Gemmatimonadaceae bacterium]|nr:class II aldolase/adducin family protein [Gemmatimonadaceae bacterium]